MDRNFSRCDFRGADVRGAHLRGAGLVGSQGESINFWKGALYDEDTAFPDGFDPQAEGLILRKLEKKEDKKKEDKK